MTITHSIKYRLPGSDYLMFFCLFVLSFRFVCVGNIRHDEDPVVMSGIPCSFPIFDGTYTLIVWAVFGSDARQQKCSQARTYFSMSKALDMG